MAYSVRPVFDEKGEKGEWKGPVEAGTTQATCYSTLYDSFENSIQSSIFNSKL